MRDDRSVQALARHPAVAAPFRKEVHFFDYPDSHRRGPLWYRAHFSLRRQLGPRGRIAFEASPYYLTHPLAPERVAALLPGVRLVALVREPVARAFSHWRHNVRLGREKASFEEAVRREEERTAGEAARLETDPGLYSFAHQNHTYLARGRYLEYLDRWVDRFGRERLLVLVQEDLRDRPAEVLAECLAFLDLDRGPVARIALRPPGADRTPEIGATLRAELAASFRPHNRRLYDFLGRDLGWDRASPQSPAGAP